MARSIKLIVKHGDDYFKLIWVNRTNRMIVAYWGSHIFSGLAAVGDLHLTYPEDGNLHYTYRDPHSGLKIRKFRDRWEYIDPKTNRRITDIPPGVTTFSESLWLPLPGVGGQMPTFSQIEVMQFPLGFMGVPFPINRELLSHTDVTELTEEEKQQAFDVTRINSRSLGVTIFLRNSEKSLPQIPKLEVVHVVEDSSKNPVISLVLALE